RQPASPARSAGAAFAAPSPLSLLLGRASVLGVFDLELHVGGQLVLAPLDRELAGRGILLVGGDRDLHLVHGLLQRVLGQRQRRAEWGLPWFTEERRPAALAGRRGVEEHQMRLAGAVDVQAEVVGARGDLRAVEVERRRGVEARPPVLAEPLV